MLDVVDWTAVLDTTKKTQQRFKSNAPRYEFTFELFTSLDNVIVSSILFLLKSAEYGEFKGFEVLPGTGSIDFNQKTGKCVLKVCTTENISLFLPKDPESFILVALRFRNLDNDWHVKELLHVSGVEFHKKLKVLKGSV